MRSLFLRIFLSFWAAQALFLVLAILVVIALRPTREPGIENLGARVISEAATQYQSGGEPAAARYLEDFNRTQNLRAFIFDPAGHEISGQMVFPWIEDMRRTGHVHHHSWPDRFLPERFLRETHTINGQAYTLVLEF